MINFELLYQLTRAMANIMILTQDQASLIRSLHVQSAGEDRQLTPSLIQVLNRMPYNLLRLMTTTQQRFFIQFVTHVFRLLIIVQSIDRNILDGDLNPLLKASLNQMLRKYAQFEIAFPLSKPLVDSLKSDVIWFSHSTETDCCNLRKFIQSEESKYQTCSNCGNVDKGLKICSRCLKAYYCNATCQKKHYSVHKSKCGVKTVEMLKDAFSRQIKDEPKS